MKNNSIGGYEVIRKGGSCGLTKIDDHFVNFFKTIANGKYLIYKSHVTVGTVII